MEKASTAFAVALLQGPGAPVNWEKRSTWTWPQELSAAPEKLGVGLDFRMPSTLGLSFSYIYQKHQVSTQISPYFNQKLYSGSYLFETVRFSKDDPTEFPFYVGVGLWMREDGGRTGLDSLGVQFPLSLQAQEERAALDVYLEYSPAIQIYPYFNFGAYMGVGVRVYHLGRVVQSKVDVYREWRAYTQDKKNPPNSSEDFD